MRSLIVAILLLVPAMAGCFNTPIFAGLGPIEPEDYLRDDTYTDWIIEIDYVVGHRPSASAVNLLKDRMGELANKDNIDVVIDDELAETNRNWNIQALLDFKRQHQDLKTKGSEIVTWVAYVDGQWHSDDSNSRTIGVALSDHETVAIMRETIESSDFLLVSETDVERTVLVHEFGHIIGLVDNGIPMQTPHSDGGSHSDNQDSVMWAGVENALDYQIFRGDPPTTFDANDKADVCAAGGKC